MYAAHTGTFLHRDPLPDYQEAVPGHSHEAVSTILATASNRYNYVDNNPASTVDPSGLQGRPARPKPQQKTCKVLVCVKPVDQAPIGGHVFILLDRGDNGGWWVYRGGPSDGENREGCKCKNQLVGDEYEYKIGNADVPKDEEERKKMSCRSMDVLASDCEVIHRCFAKVLTLANKCCVEYSFYPGPINVNACNSNCMASWLLDACITNPVLILPGGKVLPGWPRTLPQCITQPLSK